jgi:hypothetical protein
MTAEVVPFPTRAVVRAPLLLEEMTLRAELKQQLDQIDTEIYESRRERAKVIAAHRQHLSQLHRVCPLAAKSKSP